MGSKSRFVKSIIRGTGKSFACAVASAGFVASASAADLDGLVLKAPPVMPDLTWHGITLIGAIDVSGQYEQHGAPYAGGATTSSSLITPWNRSPQWLFAPSQSLQSFLGVKVEEPITSDVKFIARAEMGFNPTTGDISDALKSTQRMNGIPLNLQSMNGDGSRAGQILNGEAWAGFDSKPWGTIHIGRNNAVALDMLGAYDPLASYGFSLFGYVGLLAGQGSAETPRIDDSIKYLNSWGPIRTELMYGHPNTNAKDFFQGTIGFVRPNFSIDLIAGHVSDMLLVNALAGPANLGSQFLGARVFDTNMYGFLAKYVFDLSGGGVLATSESKFTLSGGYQRLDFSNPADGGFAPGHTTIGDYQIGPVFSTSASIATGVVNYGFTGGDRLVDISFIAGKYQYDSHLSLALAYYRYDQNSFGLGVNAIPGIVAPSYSSKSCSSSAFFNCSGNEQVVSFRADYQWTKNLMLYAGIAYSKVNGGFAFSYLTTSTFDPTVGLRFTF
ncbi:porin [Bradyrhizobium sp. Ash2021]|uniref:porin n=1 Tax=Bradyrhizobium sp. Ash2021 TaxID=2954771 RepID=UPI0028161CD0|nr:porin [Bradyrhizobium sp. Ash2021]WMT76428.1 porin [Bradyrhizobium sp. Ash2021]